MKKINLSRVDSCDRHVATNTLQNDSVSSADCTPSIIRSLRDKML